MFRVWLLALLAVVDVGAVRLIASFQFLNEALQQPPLYLLLLHILLRLSCHIAEYDLFVFVQWHNFDAILLHASQSEAGGLLGSAQISSDAWCLAVALARLQLHVDLFVFVARTQLFRSRRE